MAKKKKTKKTKKSKKVSKRKVSRRFASAKSSDNTNNIIYGALAAAIVVLVIFAFPSGNPKNEVKKTTPTQEVKENKVSDIKKTKEVKALNIPKKKKAINQSSFNEKEVFKAKDEMLDTVIRGVEGVLYASPTEIIRHEIDDSGAITRVKGLQGITTSGTNMYQIMCNKFVDAYKIQSDSVDETYQLFGIEAARKRVISELRALVKDLNHRHYMIYADEMSYTGRITSI